MEVRYQIHFRERRKERHQSLQPVATALDLSVATYSELERMIRSPRLETVDRLAHLWDIPPSQLVTFLDWPCWCCGRARPSQDLELPYGR